MIVWLVILGFTIGTVLGSLVKALADRSLKGQSFWGRSYCPRCKKNLRWYDLFPVFSYILLRGKCRYCQKPIPLEYLQVEVLMGFLIALLFLIKLPANILDLNFISASLIWIELAFNIFIICILMVVFITDIKEGFIFDRVVLPAVIITAIYLVLVSAYKVYLIYNSIVHSAIGRYLLPPYSDYFYRHAILAIYPLWTGLVAAVIIGIFFGLLIFITKGKGMGGGDLKYGIFLGLAFGFPNSVLVLLLAFLIGALVGIIVLILGKKKFGQTIPFGPFLSIGGLLTIFWGQQILDWYLSLRF
ncbi:prepilin peptidase [Candidatus Daviesbacteria bacterium]|nr:prepilin peptidase [Candidatus Daviesbacteria bacterium]